MIGGVFVDSAYTDPSAFIRVDDVESCVWGGNYIRVERTNIVYKKIEEVADVGGILRIPGVFL